MLACRDVLRVHAQDTRTVYGTVSRRQRSVARFRRQAMPPARTLHQRVDDSHRRDGDIVGAMTDDDEEVPRQVPSTDRGIEERWARPTRERDVRSVSATTRRLGEWTWSVFFAAAEFVRDEPFQTELRRAVTTALKSVPGVTKVVQEDREKWIVAGEPNGEALIKAAAAAIDGLADRIRAHIKSLATRS